MPRDDIIDGCSCPPGVGGADRDDGAPGGRGGDLVDLGDEFGVDRGDAWWFYRCQNNFNYKRLGLSYTIKFSLKLS